MRRLVSFGVALLLLVLIGLWMVTGTIVEGGQGPGNGETPVLDAIDPPQKEQLQALAENIGLAAPGEGHEGSESTNLAEAGDDAAPALVSVRTQVFTAQPMPIEITLRGRTSASATIPARAQTGGVVEEISVAKGETVEAGQLLCTLDQGTRRARLAQAEASLTQARLDLESNAALRDRGLAPANSGRALEAGVAAAEAALAEAEAELERTEIHAEIAGIVQDPIASRGERLNPGDVCATIVQLDPMLFLGSVPEARIALARTGCPVAVETVSGEDAEGEVTFISAVADPATRSFPLEAEFANANGAIRDGLTAEATVRAGVTPAHLLPQSALTLDDDGRLGVRAVDDEDIVSFHTVEIARDTREGVWVLGLPRRIEIIILGQEEVKAGQRVAATEVASEESTS